MKTSRNAIRFEAMPKDYAGLCGLLLPRPTHDQHELDNVTELAGAMAGHKLNRDQSDYFALLCKLIEDYEKEQIPVSQASGLEALRHLLAEHGLSGADLSKMLGAQPHSRTARRAETHRRPHPHSILKVRSLSGFVPVNERRPPNYRILLLLPFPEAVKAARCLRLDGVGFTRRQDGQGGPDLQVSGEFQGGRS